MIRVMIVDDSAFIRFALKQLLEKAPDIRVVGMAQDGIEALQLASRLQPDIITLDIEMPRMDGIETLKRLQENPVCPVLMISSLNEEAARATFDALDAGAVDFIPKEAIMKVGAPGEKVREKIKAMHQAKSPSQRFGADRRPRRIAKPIQAPQAPSVIAIGVSTGGPQALQQVIPALPAVLPLPVVIIQHMPAMFTRLLADRLDAMSAIPVLEARHGAAVHNSHVYIAPGGKHLTVLRQGGRTCFQVTEEPATLPHRPSVDLAFASLAKVYRSGVVSVVMTGMGSDGLQGSQVVHAHGGRVWC